MSAAPAKEAPLLERFGVRYMEGPAAEPDVAPDDAVHVLNARERQALRAIEHAAVARAAVCGALAAGVCTLPPILLHGLHERDPARYWAVYVGVNVVSALAEVAWLFWDGLRTVRALARTAGLSLASQDMARGRSVASALARAALEMPNPPDAVEGINPWREASRFTLTVAPLLYKLKVTLTNLAVKFLVRRALGRAATRAVLELVAVPVNALWDALVCWLILHEARLRVMGPSAATELTAAIFAGDAPVPAATARAAMRAVASAVVRTQDLHPNLVSLLECLRARVGEEVVLELDDPSRFLVELRALDRAEQGRVLRVLAVASVLDGRLARDEKRLLREALAAAGRADDLAPVERLRRAFTSGEVVTEETLLAIGA
ncbi:MAG: hypothetical protein U0324_00345 [Polyangiales bacterium]